MSLPMSSSLTDTSSSLAVRGLRVLRHDIGVDHDVLCYMALCTTTDFIPDKTRSDGCVHGLKRHHIETTRSPSRYNMVENMAWKEDLDVDSLVLPKLGTLGRFIAWMALVRA